LVSADALSDADRQTIVEIGRRARSGFQPQSESEPEPEAKQEVEG
jgi:hypothetical protein